MQAIRTLPLLLLIVGCADRQGTTTPSSGRTRDGVAQPDRFPAETEGEWIPASELRSAIVRLKDDRFEAMQPLPEEGYVPVQATAPTVSAIIVNDSDRYIGRVRVRAFAIDNRHQLAEEGG